MLEALGALSLALGENPGSQPRLAGTAPVRLAGEPALFRGLICEKPSLFISFFPHILWFEFVSLPAPQVLHPK